MRCGSQLNKLRVGFCRQRALKNGRCRWHGGLTPNPGWWSPSEGYSAVRKRAAATKKEAYEALGIKNPSGRRPGPMWVTDRMLVRATAIARELGFFALPSRDPSLVWLLLRRRNPNWRKIGAEKEEKRLANWRENATRALRRAEIEAAKSVIREMLGKTDA